ncbi:MAG: hypothetical protein ACOZAN_05060 [Patescibacteria group bacterium]
MPKTRQISQTKQLLAIVLIILLISAVLAALFLKVSKYLQVGQREIASEKIALESDNSIEKSFEKVNADYNNDLPWKLVKQKESHQFISKSLNGLLLVTNKASIVYDGEYQPISTFYLSKEETVPVKSAYVAYYQVPYSLMDKFGIDKNDILMPLQVTVFEFGAKLTDKEQDIIKNGKNFVCENKESQVDMASFTNQQIVIYSCNLNLTSQQKEIPAGKNMFDTIYEIYFVERNVLVQVGLMNSYISDHENYLSDYLKFVFNSKDSAAISRKDIETIEESRKFDEWRRQTFDKE